MRYPPQRTCIIWIAALFLMGGGLVGCSGSESATSDNSDQLFDEMSTSRLDQYNPSGVSYDTVYAPGDVDRPPDLKGGIRKLQGSIEYPRSALRKGITGKVWIGFIVAPNGEPRHVRVIDSAHPILDQEALSTVTGATFTPGAMREIPVPVKGVAPLTFKLQSQASNAPPND